MKIVIELNIFGKHYMNFLNKKNLNLLNFVGVKKDYQQMMKNLKEIKLGS